MHACMYVCMYVCMYGVNVDVLHAFVIDYRRSTEPERSKTKVRSVDENSSLHSVLQDSLPKYDIFGQRVLQLGLGG